MTTQHSTENVIFIFISDIGAEKMTKLVLTYGNRSAIPQTLLRSEIKSALDDQWARLRFGKVVREVVPYLPLEPEHIREILRTKLHNTARDFQYSYWADLVVDEDVVSYLSSPPLVKYSVYNARAPAGAGAGAGGTASAGKQHVPARGAAAQVQSQSRNGNQGTGSGGAAGGEGGDSAGQAAECAVGGGGGAGDCSRQPSSSAGNMGTNGQGPAPSAPSTTKIFATWGARSLENAGMCVIFLLLFVLCGVLSTHSIFIEQSVISFITSSAGPLQDLRSVLNRYTQPWRPGSIAFIFSCECFCLSVSFSDMTTCYFMFWVWLDQVLHVGLVSEANRELRNAKWGIQEKAGSTASGKVQTQVCYSS